MGQGFLIEWDNRLLHVPHDRKNPVATEDSMIILDVKVANMLEKGAIRLTNTSIPGVISGYFAHPKKAERQVPTNRLAQVYQLFHNILVI